MGPGEESSKLVTNWFARARFVLVICFHFLSPFPYGSGSATFFFFPFSGLFFGGVFFLLYPRFLSCILNHVRVCLCALLCLFLNPVPKFRFSFWKICLSIHLLPLRSLCTNPIYCFSPNSAAGAFLFSPFSNSQILLCVDRVGGGFLFFPNKKIWWLLSFFYSLLRLLNAIPNFQVRFSSVQFLFPRGSCIYITI